MTRTAGDRRWVLVLCSALSFVTALDILVTTTALPAIQADLNASRGQLAWTLAAYVVALAAPIPAVAVLGDRFGRRRLLILGVAGFAAGSVMCAIAPAATVLIGGRVLQGAGAGFIAPLTLPLVAAAYPRGQRGRALGIQAGVTGLATFAGPLLGGAITQVWGWQWIFWLNVPVGVLLAVLLRVKVLESYGPRRPVDVGGLGFITVALGGYAWSLVRVADTGWTAPDIFAGLAMAVLSTLGFVVWERRTRAPVFPARLFTLRPMNAANAATVLHGAVVLGAVFVMAQYLQGALHYGALDAGFRLLPWTGSMMLVAPLAGRAIDRAGPRTVAVTGLAVAGVGYGGLALFASTTSYAALLMPLVIAGVGTSAVFPAFGAALAEAAAPGDIGSASGLNAVLREFGGILGVAAVAAAFAAGPDDPPDVITAGFSAAMGLCAASMLAGAVMSLFLPYATALRDSRRHASSS